MATDTGTLRKLVIRAGIIIAAVCGVVLVAEYTGLLAKPENMVYDHRMYVTAPVLRPSEDIALVLLDQDSLDWANQELGWSWPWPRSAYGDLVRFFQEGGAASVVFDVLYTEPSVYGAADDESFAAACKDYGRVVQSVFFDDIQGTFSGWKDGAPLPPFGADGEPGSSPVLFPVDSICNAAAVLGNVNSTVSSDGTIRQLPLYYQYGDYSVPSLGLAPVYAAGESLPLPETEPAGGRLLRFQRSLESYVPYSAAQILQSYYAVQNGGEPLLEPEMFSGMYVFFGFYAPGLFDICSTPVSAVYPGVGLHITLLDNLLQDTFLTRVPAVLVFLLVLVCAAAGAVPVSAAEMFHWKRFTAVAAGICFVAVGILYTVLAYIVFAAGFVIPVAAPLVALVLSFGTAVLVCYSREGKQRRYLKSAFRQYLSPAVIEDLIAHPERLALGGERRRISIYFSDVQGFTSISEKLEPQELTALLNDYLSVMTDIILESGGTIDKYEGDAVIAFWNAPVSCGDHARRALEAAVRCQEKLAELRPGFERRTGLPFYMRIGLNTGDAVVGNMGSRSRFDYTMLGDSVNLAARLEGLNKQFGTYCMCSLAAKTEAEQAGTALCFRELARAAVVGKKEAVTVFEPMTAAEYRRRKDVLQSFENALHLFYEGQFAAAEKAFTALADRDVPAARYVEKCRRLQEQPPAGEWLGVWVAETK